MRYVTPSPYVLLYKGIYLTALMLNPIAAFIFLRYIFPGYQSDAYDEQYRDYIVRRLPFHIFVIGLNLLSWYFYKNGSKFGLLAEKALSLSRMLMIICGASIVFAFITIESPIADILWKPMHVYLLNDTLILLYIMVCLLLFCAEFFYYKKL